MSKRRVVVVDDHPIFSQGLAVLLGSTGRYEVVGTASTIGDGIALVERESPDLLVADLSLGEEDGLELVKRARAGKPGMRILVLSMMDERHYARRALASGANGYAMKGESAPVVIEAMDAVASGGTWLSPRERDRVIDAAIVATAAGLAAVDSLSERQFQVFRLVGKGLDSHSIAARLSISKKTVDAHKEELKRRLGVPSTQELLRLAIEWGDRER
ncbi:MAG TPA: response regulator transcription factor [Treponemataceae bacterium]|jgi:DNA-binding NarL/FixJ family response regulator|nr:response regulator transcription factor [Treponemataceae bacterium]